MGLVTFVANLTSLKRKTANWSCEPSKIKTPTLKLLLSRYFYHTDRKANEDIRVQQIQAIICLCLLKEIIEI